MIEVISESLPQGKDRADGTQLPAPGSAAGIGLAMGHGPSRKGAKDQIIERYEQKYLIHPRLVPQIRKWIQPFVIPDPNGRGEIPEYVTTTLQLDTAHMELALAKERKLQARFKLRIRTYGTDSNPRNPVFFELKRKINGVIIKSRARMSRGQFHKDTVTNPASAPMLKSPKENYNFLEFCRVARAINAAPKMLIRYIRESYFGANDDYARLTFDRRICYRPTREWVLPGEEVADRKFWRPMDTQTGLRTPYPAYIFELKAMRDTPRWMLELVERFNLTSLAICKYSTAWRLESLFRGFEYAAGSENTTAGSPYY